MRVSLWLVPVISDYQHLRLTGFYCCIAPIVTLPDVGKRDRIFIAKKPRLIGAFC